MSSTLGKEACFFFSGKRTPSCWLVWLFKNNEKRTNNSGTVVAVIVKYRHICIGADSILVDEVCTW